MICIDYPTYDLVQNVLRSSSHPEARTASEQLRQAVIEMIERDSRINSEVPALCRPQI